MRRRQNVWQRNDRGHRGRLKKTRHRNRQKESRAERKHQGFGRV